MSYTLFKPVNFGPAKGGLATVGYKITGGSRITAGVAEIGTATGCYGATITFADAFAGSVLWDTGEATPAYAVDECNLSNINLGQAITDVQTATVGGALAGAWAAAWGKMVRSVGSLTLGLWGPGNATGTASKTFTLDDGTNPTSRT